MKKISKISLMMILTFIFLMGFKTQVSAVTYPAYGQYKLTWNIENVYYYLDSSATQYSGTIANAANNWVYTGLGYNKLWPNTRIYDILGTTVDIYAYNEGKTGREAYTATFKLVNGVQTNVPWVLVTPYREATGVPSENYTFAEIHINSGQVEGYPNTKLQGIIAHEFGHCWGLGHNPENRNSLMHNYSNTRNYYTVQQVDQDIFNILYP